jgi:hypothetical protein
MWKPDTRHPACPKQTLSSEAGAQLVLEELVEAFEGLGPWISQVFMSRCPLWDSALVWSAFCLWEVEDRADSQ